ncbi:MAG: ABC transporter permease subunit [Gammaproteobacteria bacterium]
MALFKNTAYTKEEAVKWPMPNYWDAVAFCLIFAGLIWLAWSAKQMTLPFHMGQSIPISLDPRNLPSYALRTVLRMFIGLFFALIFTFTFGTWAGKSKRAACVIIPIIDILQSVPVLSFLTITVTGFIALFSGSMLGPECAAIFAIFTAQVWNMTLSFYQSVRTVPHDLREASRIFHLSAWQRFWRIDVPFAMPGLLWNVMMSMSGSWFFVTASEAFSVANQQITLPGVGSYIALAIVHADKHALFYAILTMFVVILLYDQLLFRPLSHWVQRFKFDSVEDVTIEEAWVVKLFQRTLFLNRFGVVFEALGENIVNLPFLNRQKIVQKKKVFTERQSSIMLILGRVLLGFLVILCLGAIANYIFTQLRWDEVRHLFLLGGFTGLRVMSLIVISSLIWVPVGVWIGSRPGVATVIQPIVQFLAAFPANLAFPVVALLIVRFNLNVEIWASPLMVLGTQWYILFNVIAGTTALPKDLKQATATFGVHGFLRWKRLVLPGIFPYFLTGAITAAGGAWNASILAEAVSWGSINLHATGLGAYISEASSRGDFTQVVLGTIIMCVFVVLINRLIWRPLYNLAAEKFTLG